MPAFDPVRDAVLNSPVTPTQPLNSPYGRVDLSSASPASPTLTRRATDLSVLLNADSQQPPFRSPSTSQPPTLAHLLHPNDTVDDRLAHAEPLRRPSIEILQEGSPHMSRTYEPSFSRPTLPPNVPPLSAVPSSQPSTADSAQTLPSPAQSPFMQSISRPPSSVPASPPSISPVQKSQISAPHPPRSTLPYKPTRRITPASSVMIPMSEAERQMYAQLQGTGTQKLSKRKRAPSTEREDVRPIKKHLGDVGVVVAHYNERPDVGVVQRFESPIIGLKNFNNWIKSVLITRFAHPVLAGGSASNALSTPSSRPPKGGSGRVLDVGIGKGGDLTKWAKARIRDLVGADIAAVSVDQARARWESLRGRRYDATFATIDCYSESLAVAIPPAKLAQPFDVVSMQFCMHYAFESVQKARCMLDNVSRWLRPGGVFIGTIPNAEQLLERLDGLPPNAEDLSFGNSVYTVRFDDRVKRPQFGHKYWFYLQDAVENVPEYIVRWDDFVELASEYKLHPVYKQEFHQVYEENQQHPEFQPLMVKMKVVDAKGESAMTEDQWEAANIYIAFAFEKR